MSDTRTVDVLDAKGAKSGTVELPAELFDVPANIPLIHQVVTAQLAAARQGTHATKTRGEVRGGGAKPYRQKGTGRARQGSRRSTCCLRRSAIRRCSSGTTLRRHLHRRSSCTSTSSSKSSERPMPSP